MENLNLLIICWTTPANMQNFALTECQLEILRNVITRNFIFISNKLNIDWHHKKDSVLFCRHKFSIYLIIILNRIYPIKELIPLLLFGLKKKKKR